AFGRSEMTAAIDEVTVRVAADTTPFRDALGKLGSEADSFSSAVTSAFRSAIAGGRTLDDILKSLALRGSAIAFDHAFEPISNAIGGALDGLTKAFGCAKGGVVGGVEAFADGGIVSSPTVFPLGSRVGLMGEAGTEAVLPLARGSDGRLGVRSQTVSPMNV